MAKKKTLKDGHTGEVIYPLTITEQVVGKDGKTIERVINDKFSEQDKAIENRHKLQEALINEKQLEIGAMEFDTTPTDGSGHGITSGGVYAAFKSSEFVDDEPTAGSENLVTSGGVFKAIKDIGDKIDDTLEDVGEEISELGLKIDEVYNDVLGVDIEEMFDAVDGTRSSCDIKHRFAKGDVLHVRITIPAQSEIQTFYIRKSAIIYENLGLIEIKANESFGETYIELKEGIDNINIGIASPISSYTVNCQVTSPNKVASKEYVDEKVDGLDNSISEKLDEINSNRPILNLFDKSVNRINYISTFTTDEYKDVIIVGAQLSSTYNFYRDQTKATSPLISVKPLQKYTSTEEMSLDRKMFFVRNDGSVISYLKSGYSFVTPSDCAYIRFAFDVLNIESLSIEEGDTATPNLPRYDKAAGESKLSDVESKLKSLEKNIVSNNITVNDFIRAIYVNFDNQSTYKQSDINKVRFCKGSETSKDWFFFLLNDSTIVTGGHVYEEPKNNSVLEFTRNNIKVYVAIDWTNVPTVSTTYNVTFNDLEYLGIEAKVVTDSMNRNVLSSLEYKTNRLIDRSVQVSDGLTLTSASAPQLGFDKSSGLIGCASQCGWLVYGESYQQIRLDIFPVTQPTNVKHITICKQGQSIGNGETFSSSGEVNVLSLENRTWRVMFKHKVGWWYRDYHYDTDTIDDAVEMKVSINGELKSITSAEHNSYCASVGKQETGDFNILTSSYYRDENGRVYGCWTGYRQYPILFYSDDDLQTIVPFATFDETAEYEASICYNKGILHLVSRATNYAAYSNDNGITWTKLNVNGGNNRPRIYKYGDNLVWVVGNSRGHLVVKYGSSTYENAQTIFDFTLPYGLVYPSLFIWENMMWMAYCDAELQLDNHNLQSPTNWRKDCVKWVKLGAIE